MIVYISEEMAVAKSRVTAIRLASLTLRCMENWRRVAGGYDEAMIILGVVAVTSDRLLRSNLSVEFRDLANPLPTENLSHCNLASIATATGLNRETVRRKINTLIAAGFLVRSGDGAVNFASGVLQDPQMLDLIRSQLDSFRQLTEGLFNEGIFRTSST